MKVKALAKGQYKGVMKYQGEVFDIERVDERAEWMQEVNIVPLRVTGNMLPKNAEFEQSVEEVKEEPKEGESNEQI